MNIIIPDIVRQISWLYDAWVVGGAARVLSEIEEPPIKDWDLIVPFYNWGKACLLIPKGTPANAFGGFKVKEKETEIDIWCGDLGFFLKNAPKNKQQVAIHLPSNHIIKIETLKVNKPYH